MAEVGLINPSLIDVMNNTNADGSIVKIVETMEQMNPILRHANYQECNNGSKHKTTVRTGIPTPAYRRYNQGVQPSNTQEVPIEDTTGMIEDYLKVDKALADLSGNHKQFRANKSKGIMQGFNNFVASEIFYGSPNITPEGFMGMSPRYSMLPTNAEATASARQVIDAGGTGSDNASIWFITWGETQCQLLYPRGSQAGFRHRDLGEDTDKKDGAEMQIYRDHFKWDIGLTDQDWRANSRICNIDVSALTADASSGANLIELLFKARNNLDDAATAGGKTCIYVPRNVFLYLELQMMNKVAGSTLKYEDIGGKRCMYWGEYEVARVDALLETEARVV